MGLILPAALDIAPVLVPLAAVGLVLLMVGAIVTRLRRHDKVIVVNVIYLALAVFVAWGRFGPESFTGSPDKPPLAPIAVPPGPDAPETSLDLRTDDPRATDASLSHRHRTGRRHR